MQQHTTDVRKYIEQKLADLEKGKDLDHLYNKGLFSFGMDSTTYGHLPAWENMLKQKKKLMRWVYIDGFLLSLMIIGMTSDFIERMNAGNWWKMVLGMMTISAACMFFYVLVSFYSLFVHFRRVEREGRKLIYQDILYKMEKEQAVEIL